MSNVEFFSNLSGGGSADIAWGGITGDITDQEDLVEYIDSIVGDIGGILDFINGVVV